LKRYNRVHQRRIGDTLTISSLSSIIEEACHPGKSATSGCPDFFPRGCCLDLVFLRRHFLHRYLHSATATLPPRWLGESGVLPSSAAASLGHSFVAGRLTCPVTRCCEEIRCSPFAGDHCLSKGCSCLRRRRSLPLASVLVFCRVNSC
jgi:hypothetical protein